LVTAPWSAESRSNRANFGILMRVQTGVQHDPMGYGLGLMVTKCAPQVDATIFLNDAYHA
jgi:hypothetical protein